MGRPANLGKVEDREAEVLNGQRLLFFLAWKGGWEIRKWRFGRIMEGGIEIINAHC